MLRRLVVWQCAVCVAAGWSYLTPEQEQQRGWRCLQEVRESPPVHIDTARTEYDHSLAPHPLTFKNYEVFAGAGVQFSMLNNGRSLEVAVSTDPAHNISISGAALPGPGATYKLEQFHLHWDNVSEVTVDGRAYPLRLHLVHWNVRYEHMSEAARRPDGLVVLVVLFELAAAGPVARVPVGVEHMVHGARRPEVRSPHAGELKLAPFPMWSLVPARGRADYFRYRASLAAPAPCAAVTWLVFRQPLVISRRYLDMFRSQVRLDPPAADPRPGAPHRAAATGFTIYRSAPELGTSAAAAVTSTCTTVITALSLLHAQVRLQLSSL